MISTRDRREAIELIDEAVAVGARRAQACELLGLSVRTVQRWTREGGVGEDRRPSAVRPKPPNALSDAERGEVLAVCNSPAYASLPPSQIVPRLADEGLYLASESTFYRVLREHDAQHHRGRAKAPRAPTPPPSHTADGPNQVWCWDITYLPGPVRGMFFYLYLILDLYSRKIVGWEVHAAENGEHASALIRRAVLAEGVIGQPLVLHADNGGPQKGSTLMATLEHLGILPSHSRPHVSDDNAYAETVFRTLKYRPAYPVNGFADLNDARAWVLDFVGWYNTEHRHSRLRFVTPAQRHTSTDVALLAQRRALYEQAKAERPERWSGAVRDWTPPGPVTLNPAGASATATPLAQAA
jgi:transposase InsO family protein